MKKRTKRFRVLPGLVFVVFIVGSLMGSQVSSPRQQAQEILTACNLHGGLVVHVGCGDGALTAALRASDGFLVHGLDTDAANVELAREHIKSLGLYGGVSVDRLAGRKLPYIDNLVTLVVAEDLGKVSMSEVMRVLSPEGVAYIKSGRKWKKTVKPRPKEIDEWTHYLHDASNNAVAHDSVIGPPRRMQWIGSPRWARHHDHMSSVSAVVSAGRRIFYIFDEASRFSVLLEPKWSLIARDAFNGTILWKRPIENWHTHLWPLKSGPAQLPRRLVASGDRVYVTLGIDAPVTALDAATGETVRTYETTKGAEEMILSDGVLFALVNTQTEGLAEANIKRTGGAYGAKFWDEAPREIAAIRADTGKVLWTKTRRVLPVTLAADSDGLFYHDGSGVVALDRKTGDKLWGSDPIERAREIRSFYAPILVVYDGVVLFSGGETAGLQTGSWYTSGKDTMTAVSAKTGKVLWSAYHPPSGYRSPEDLLVANGLVWTGETTSGRAVGVFQGRDPYTGEVKIEFGPDVDPYWFHHRCYRGKATDNFLLMSRAGIEFIDVKTKQWTPNHWVRGACLYGIMPANGMVYNPQHPCACYHETKLFGFNALAPASKRSRIPKRAASAARLEKGPAYARSIAAASGKDDWPTYRGDVARSGRTDIAVPTSLKRAWETKIGGKVSSPVIAGGKVFVAAVDTHAVHAIDADSGKQLWSYTVGGRVDSPPTIYQGRVLFGSRDGWVYCLAASDGALAWRFRAAPMDQRLTSFEQVESVWPVHGSVLVQNGAVYCVAGRSMFLDGGLHFWRLDPKTGREISHTTFGDHDEKGKDLHEYIAWLNAVPALPDILSSDGRFVYMRSQAYNLDGTRPPLSKPAAGKDADAGAPPPTQRPEFAHLFCPTGFLDDSWWHRTYWMYGSDFISGWCGYFLAGKAAPAGRIIVHDDDTVYAFGRKPQYFRWTTPIEHHLFASPKAAGDASDSSNTSTGPSLIRIEKSASINPAGKAITVQAWVNSEKASGVILARGGGAMGYTLYVQGGRPHFALRAGGKVAAATGKQKITGKWAHVAGVVTAEKELRIYVDGKLAGSAKAASLISGDPTEAMEIGVDGGSAVGEYRGPVEFTGIIDEISVYHRALSAAEIGQLASEGPEADVDRTGLVLEYSFDKGNAADVSDGQNDGKIEGAVAVEGKFGKAMRFAGKPARASGYTVQQTWTADLPIFARAMVLADETLFVAGPVDIVDEPQAFSSINDPQTAKQLAEQAAALAGERGGVLLAVSTEEGETLSLHKLDGLPIFDGMIASNKRLYMTMTDGRVVCMTGK